MWYLQLVGNACSYCEGDIGQAVVWEEECSEVGTVGMFIYLGDKVSAGDIFEDVVAVIFVELPQTPEDDIEALELYVEGRWFNHSWSMCVVSHGCGRLGWVMDWGDDRYACNQVLVAFQEMPEHFQSVR